MPGPRRAVPATKTVTAQFAAFAIIAQSLGEIGLDEKVAGALPRQVAQVLADPGPVAELADWLRDADRLVTVARGLLLRCGAGSRAENGGDDVAFDRRISRLRTSGTAPSPSPPKAPPVLAFAHPGPASKDVVDVVAELRARGASVRLAGPVEGSDLAWPASAPEVVAPVLAVVRGQQLALSLALELGRDPDSPPGLMKVTAT